MIEMLFPMVDTENYVCDCNRPSELCDCGDYEG